MLKVVFRVYSCFWTPYWVVFSQSDNACSFNECSLLLGTSALTSNSSLAIYAAEIMLPPTLFLKNEFISFQSMVFNELMAEAMEFVAVL